jgi:hypothetical protein
MVVYLLKNDPFQRLSMGTYTPSFAGCFLYGKVSFGWHAKKPRLKGFKQKIGDRLIRYKKRHKTTRIATIHGQITLVISIFPAQTESAPCHPLGCFSPNSIFSIPEY